MTDDPKVREMVVKRVEKGLMDASVLKRMDKEMVDPSAFAKIAAFLASDDAALVNGQVFLTTAITIARYSKPETVTTAENAIRRPMDHGYDQGGICTGQDSQGLCQPGSPGSPEAGSEEVEK